MTRQQAVCGHDTEPGLHQFLFLSCRLIPLKAAVDNASPGHGTSLQISNFTGQNFLSFFCAMPLSLFFQFNMIPLEKPRVFFPLFLKVCFPLILFVITLSESGHETDSIKPGFQDLRRGSMVVSRSQSGLEL